jgi:5-methylcytosine-specific restriction endonuclease McrA
MKHRVTVKNPHPKSMAAGILLKRWLRKKEVDDWLRFRSKFLAKKKQQHGCLKCYYCDKQNLKEDVDENSCKRELSRLATIDHIVPRSKGGTDDEDNLVVACFTCNQRKGDSIVVVMAVND